MDEPSALTLGELCKLARVSEHDAAPLVARFLQTGVLVEVATPDGPRYQSAALLRQHDALQAAVAASYDLDDDD